MIKIGTELASTRNTSTSEYDSQTAKQSSLTAGKTLTIIADGSAPGTAGDTRSWGPYKARRKIEKAKARVRAKVEHPFRVIKRQFGYVKTRDRGLTKNTAQRVTLFALSNLWMARRY